MDSVLNVNRTTKRNLTAVGHERDLCHFIGSFIGKGELFPSAGKFHGFCDSGFPGVRSAPIMQFSPHVRLMADSTPSFLIAEIRRIHVFLITGLFSFVTRFMMVS